jgi:YHS domain-containing protein
MMNRCITCGKLVTRRKAENTVELDGHSYLVCCPLCEKEFRRDPAHYVAVAEAAFGEYAAKANSQTYGTQSGESDAIARPSDQVMRMLYRLQGNFDQLRAEFKELHSQFDRVSESGGLEGLRAALLEHGHLLDTLNREMSVHAGLCKFVISITETEVVSEQRPVATH